MPRFFPLIFSLLYVEGSLVPFLSLPAWNSLFVAFFLYPLLLNAFPPENESRPFRMGFEVETDDAVVLRLFPLIDWETFTSKKNDLSEEHFREPFPLVTREDLDRLPASIREKLTQELNLETVSILSKEPSKSILGPDGNTWSDTLLNAPQEIKIPKAGSPVIPSQGGQKTNGLLLPEGLGTGSKDGLAGDSDWRKLRGRWTALWETLPLEERRTLYPVEALRFDARAELFRKGILDATGGKKNRSMRIPLKKSTPIKLKDVFSRVVVSVDTNENLEWKHARPVDDPELYLSDLYTFLELAGLKEAADDPTRKLIPIFGLHQHFSRKDGRSLRHFRNQYRKLLLLRLISQKRVDAVLGARAAGNVKYSESDVGIENDIVLMARVYSEEGKVMRRETDHFEVKVHTTDPRSETKELVKFLSLSDKDAQLAVLREAEPLLTKESYEEILKRSVAVASSFVDSNAGRWREKAYPHLRAIASDRKNALWGKAQLLLSQMQNKPIPLSILEEVYKYTDAETSRWVRQSTIDWIGDPVFRRELIQRILKYPSLAKEQTVVRHLLKYLSPSAMEVLYDRMGVEEHRYLLLTADTREVKTPAGTAFLLKAIQDPHLEVGGLAINRYPQLMPERPVDEMVAMTMKMVVEKYSCAEMAIEKLAVKAETEPKIAELLETILRRHDSLSRVIVEELLRTNLSPPLSKILFNKEFGKLSFELQLHFLEFLPRSPGELSPKTEAITMGILKYGMPFAQVAVIDRVKGVLRNHPGFIQFLEENQDSHSDILKQAATQTLQKIRSARAPLPNPSNCQTTIEQIK